MKTRIIVYISRLFLLFTLIALWELLSRNHIINEFIFSSPSKIIKCIINLYKNGNLINHIYVTINETIISFLLSIFISLFIAIILYELPLFYKIIEPMLTMLNSMPKVAIGPLIIILFGAGKNSIIIMSLSITLILNILSIYNAFINTNKYLENLLKSLGSSRLQKLKYLVIPSAYNVIINSLKINISMTLVGVIMGEFLVSKAGLGYLIIYGTQVFNLTLVMSSITILMFTSYIIFIIISLFEKVLKKS